MVENDASHTISTRAQSWKHPLKRLVAFKLFNSLHDPLWQHLHLLGPFTRTSVLCLLARKEHTSFPVDIFKITSFWSFGNFFKLRCFGRQLTNGSCFWFLRSGNELKFKIVSVLLWQTSPAFYQTHARNRALQRWKCTGIFLPTALKMVAENVCPRNSEFRHRSFWLTMYCKVDFFSELRKHFLTLLFFCYCHYIKQR